MDWATILSGGVSALAGGGINFAGNLIGEYLAEGQAGGKSERENKAVQDALGMTAGQAPNFLINTNAAGQKGNAARVGYQKAEGSFAPDASLVQDRASANRMAGEMQDTLGARTEAERRMRQIQQNRTQTQIGDMAGLTGGNARAMNDVTRGIGEQVAQSNLQGNEQIGQQAVRAAGMGQDMRMQGGQAYQQGLQQQYQRDVVPYMNQFQNMEGLAATTAQSAYTGAQDTIINNPFQALGDFANAYGGAMAKKVSEYALQPGDYAGLQKQNKAADINIDFEHNDPGVQGGKFGFNDQIGAPPAQTPGMSKSLYTNQMMPDWLQALGGMQKSTYTNNMNSPFRPQTINNYGSVGNPFE